MCGNISLKTYKKNKIKVLGQLGIRVCLSTFDNCKNEIQVDNLARKIIKEN